MKYIKNSIFLLLLLISAFRCSGELKEDSGAELSKQFCSNCHSYPNPNLLDKASWKNHILPRMRQMMGYYIYEDERQNLIGGEDSFLKQFYPTESIIGKNEWLAIERFYLDNAPESLEPYTTKSYVTQLDLFDAQVPQIQFSPPSSTLAQFGREEILLGDAHTQSFIQIDQEGSTKNIAKTKEGLVHLAKTPNSYLMTNMGNFSPSDEKNGIVFQLPKNKNESIKILVNDLNRPVHSTYADFNNDGLTDIVISEYGKWQGVLSIHIAQQNGKFLKKNILQLTGAIKTQAADINNDGLLDLISLFGQAKEGFYLHTNLGDGKFKTESLITLSPSHGSSFFDMIDFDLDGDLDIVYCAGDNADFPPIIKPYHGIYLYENNGKFKFTQKQFLPLPGAYGAKLADYDLDGDLDIAAIAFFPDYSNSEYEGFYYFENQGSDFKRYQPVKSELGRWIRIDNQDYDQDGDIDLILASLAFEAPNHNQLVTKWSDNAIPYLILENRAEELK